MITRTVVLAALVSTIAALSPAAAAAQGAHTGGAHTGGAAASPPADPFARAYTDATRAWHEGRYEEALERFRALHDRSGRAELLYDIGVTADRLDRLEEAIEAFEGYLARVPGARNRADVERRLASLRVALRERQQDAAQPTPPPARAPRDERPVMQLLGEPAPATASTAAATTSVAVSPGYRTPSPEPVVIEEGGGPVFVWTWPLLLLTAGAAIAVPVVWLEGEAKRDELLERCQLGTGTCDVSVVRGELEGYEVATNALWISAVGLGVITAIVFFVEGSARTTVVRRTVSSREALRLPPGLRLRVGLGGLGVEGSF